MDDAPALSEEVRSRLPAGGPHFRSGNETAESIGSVHDDAAIELGGESVTRQIEPPAAAPVFVSMSATPDERLESLAISGRNSVLRDCPTRGRWLRLDKSSVAPGKNSQRRTKESPAIMSHRGIPDRLRTLIELARRAMNQTESDAVMLFAERPLDWEAIRDELGRCKLLVAYSAAALGTAERVDVNDDDEDDEEAEPAVPEPIDGILWLKLDDGDGPTHERLTTALLEAVADELVRPGASVVALYRSFDDEEIDSMSVIRLDEHLERLTAADLRKLETQVPLETLKAVVDLAVDIGREGREGHPVGTMFVVGDTRKVMKQSSPMGFDPFHGYSAKEKNLRDRRVREEIKENAQLDGAIIIDRTGTVIAARRRIDSPASGLLLSRGLGTRHWAAAAVSKATKAIAIVVSQSSGTVRIFQNGHTVLRVEPLRRRPMKWQEFDTQPPETPEWLA